MKKAILVFVLTFLLISVGFVAMHQCQRNLVGLEVSFAGVEPCLLYTSPSPRD